MTILDIINNLGKKAKAASIELRVLNPQRKKNAYEILKKNINENAVKIFNANKLDVENAINNKLSKALINRLKVTEDTISGMIKSITEIENQSEPIGKILENWEQPNGLKFSKISVPLGVLGVIYESRPNVTIDASTIAVKAGNAVILRGGKDSFHSSSKLYELIKLAFSSCGLPENTVQMIPVTDRAAVDCMLNLDTYIDIIIPRGGKGLIKNIKEKSSIPVIKHLDGICHVYVDRDADISIAKKVILNS